MPGRTAYDEGTPNWVELRTPEPEAARSFYGRLFGWTFGERPEARAVKNGGFVAAIASGPDAPATWNTYLNVADVDAAAARVEQGGGTLLDAAPGHRRRGTGRFRRGPHRRDLRTLAGGCPHRCHGGQ